MEKKVGVEEILLAVKNLSIDEFDAFILNFIKRKDDKSLGIKELDNNISAISNQILLLSLHLKQNYLLNKSRISTNQDEIYYSKKEIAKMYKVQERTITNWIRDGLEVVEIGGVIRISKNAIELYCKKAKMKKFNWISIKNNS